MTSWAEQILDRAAHGEIITDGEAETLLDAESTDLGRLMQAANQITRRYFGNKVSMCAIYPAKVGLCSGDCAFCSQSAHNSSGIKATGTDELDENVIINNARTLYLSGVRRYSLVTSGEYLTDTEFGRILHIFYRLGREIEIGLCASLGSLTEERAGALKSAGVSRYHHNIETSRSYFPQICSTHTFDDKIKTIGIARKAGLEVCSGGIIAMGESPRQRVEMAFALKELDVDCVPLNILNPISGTRFEKQSPLTVEEILRTIAVFRLILRDKPLVFAGGREKALGINEYRGYAAGISALLAGNYLTTSGKAIEREIRNLKAAGLELARTCEAM